MTLPRIRRGGDACFPPAVRCNRQDQIQPGSRAHLRHNNRASEKLGTFHGQEQLTIIVVTHSEDTAEVEV